MMRYRISTKQNKDEIQYDYLKYVHKLEIEKRKQLDSRVKTLLTVNAILLGFILTYGKEFFTKSDEAIKISSFEITHASFGIVLIFSSFLGYLCYYLHFLLWELSNQERSPLLDKYNNVQKVNEDLFTKIDALKKYSNISMFLTSVTTVFLVFSTISFLPIVLQNSKFLIQGVAAFVLLIICTLIIWSILYIYSKLRHLFSNK